MIEKEYAVYKGDDLLVMGTAKECAAFLGVQPKTIKFHTTPTGIKRREGRKHPEKATTVIKLDY